MTTPHTDDKQLEPCPLSASLQKLRDSPMPDDQRLQVLLNIVASLAERVETLERGSK